MTVFLAGIAAPQAFNVKGGDQPYKAGRLICIDRGCRASRLDGRLGSIFGIRMKNSAGLDGEGRRGMGKRSNFAAFRRGIRR